MKLQELQSAANLLRALKEAEEACDVLAPMSVTGVFLSLNPDKSPADSALLQKGNRSTGWSGSIGFPDDLADALTAALLDWAQTRVDVAQAELKALGVEL